MRSTGALQAGEPVVRFLHTSDWQLGMRRLFLDDDAQARFEQARIDAIRTIARVAREQDCAFVVVAGDVFESNHLQPRTIGRAIEALRDVSVPIYLLPGNHDPLDPSSILTRSEFVEACPANVRVLAGQFETPVFGVEVHGAPWRSKRPSSDLVADVCGVLEPAPVGVLRVLVAHGRVESFARFEASRINQAAAEEALTDGRIHYLALGDRHSTLSVGTTGRFWYSGAPEPTDFREDDPGNALIVDLEPDGCSVTPIRIGEWRFVQHEADVNGEADVQRLGWWLDEIPEKERCILRLGLRGTVSIETKAALDTLIGEQGARFAAIDGWERQPDLVVLPDASDLDAIHVGGYARDALERLVEQARHEDEGATPARDAIGLLHRLARSAG